MTEIKWLEPVLKTFTINDHRQSVSQPYSLASLDKLTNFQLVHIIVCQNQQPC